MSALAEHTRSELMPLDSFRPDFIANPYSFYVTYCESDTVDRGTPPEPQAPGCWYIMRHEDARLMLEDPRFCVEFGRVIPPEFPPPIPEPFRPFFEMTGDWLIFRDPPIRCGCGSWWARPSPASRSSPNTGTLLAAPRPRGPSRRSPKYDAAH